MLAYLIEKNKQMDNFYTSNGISVYVKEPLTNGLDIEEIMQYIEERLPRKFLSEVEMVIIGQFAEFEERKINAMYRDGCLYITNEQDDREDIIDDIVHEIAHSLEEPYGYEIYADGKLEAEFLNKRRDLRNILWDHGYKTQVNFFLNTEYDVEFDNFLLNTVGYDKLALLMQGMFISPYAATSLREYFASGFTEFVMFSDHNLLKTVSPVLYKKIKNLYNDD
jgi:hypothetical protein